MNTESHVEKHVGQNKSDPLNFVYELLDAKTALEMSNNYTAEDQKLMESGQWDYDNSELITNKVKTLLEQIDSSGLTEDEADWRDEILWFWYHHAISCAIWSKHDQKAAQLYSEKALELQPENHPNKITKLLSHLVHDELEQAEQWAETIIQEPEKSTAANLITEYKERGFFNN